MAWIKNMHRLASEEKRLREAPTKRKAEKAVVEVAEDGPLPQGRTFSALVGGVLITTRVWCGRARIR